MAGMIAARDHLEDLLGHDGTDHTRAGIERQVPRSLQLGAQVSECLFIGCVLEAAVALGSQKTHNLFLIPILRQEGGEKKLACLAASALPSQFLILIGETRQKGLERLAVADCPGLVAGRCGFISACGGGSRRGFLGVLVGERRPKVRECEAIEPVGAHRIEGSRAALLAHLLVELEGGGPRGC